jgi:hypothetical protein
VYTGGKSAPYGPACTASSNATLSSTNYNVVTFSAPSGTLSAPTGYDLLRTAGTVSNQSPQMGLGVATPNGFISATPPTTGTQVGGASLPGSVSTAQSASPLNDQSNTTSAYTVSTATAYAFQVLDAISAAAPQLKTYMSTGGTPVAVTSSLNGVNVVTSAGITDAALATGVVLVPGITGHTMTVVGAAIIPTGGTVAACTAINITDSDLSTTDVFSFLVSGTLTAIMYDEASPAAQVTIGANTAFGTAFASGKGIGFISTGSTCTTATTFKVRVYYKVN